MSAKGDIPKKIYVKIRHECDVHSRLCANTIENTKKAETFECFECNVNDNFDVSNEAEGRHAEDHSADTTEEGFKFLIIDLLPESNQLVVIYLLDNAPYSTSLYLESWAPQLFKYDSIQLDLHTSEIFDWVDNENPWHNKIKEIFTWIRVDDRKEMVNFLKRFCSNAMAIRKSLTNFSSFNVAVEFPVMNYCSDKITVIDYSGMFGTLK